MALATTKCTRPVPTYAACWAVCIGVLMAFGGCSGSSDDLRFALNSEGREADTIDTTQRETVGRMLDELFGTPDRPRVPAEAAEQLRVELLETAAGPARTDASGCESGLYRRHCATCHGISGNGAGPTAMARYLYPRDFRNGLYKYTSTTDGTKPVREDLVRITRQGIPGTAMPSFAALPDAQLQALIEYVKYISIRGETELYLIQAVVDLNDEPPIDELVEDVLMPVVAMWTDATNSRIDRQEAEDRASRAESPKLLAASIARGAKLFRDKKAQCVSCHGETGRGDGEQTELYDHWNKPKRGTSDEETHTLAARFALPIEQLMPRDFTREPFHGGSRPMDLYWRIYGGIRGTPMPAVGSAASLTPEEIWDVLRYVRVLGGRG